MDYVQLGELKVSRFIIGGNPFSGFSHQSRQRSQEMLDYYTAANVKVDLRLAEGLGINAVIARADNHIVRVLREYWAEGGQIQWIAQTCPEMVSLKRAIDNALGGGASACYIHGGTMDNMLSNGKLDLVLPAIEQIKSAGLPAGVAGHDPGVFQWAEDNVNVDFYMCSYYNPSNRRERAEHVEGIKEAFLDSDREVMINTIQGLSRPVIHYKVLAAGRNEPGAAFARVARALRPQDAVCVGIFSGDDPQMLVKDVKLFTAALASGGPA